MATFPALMLFSCQQEEAMPDIGEICHDVELNVGFSVTADMPSRAGRPLTSIDAWQSVKDMRVYMFRSESGEEGTFKLYHPFIEDELTGKKTKQPNINIPQFVKEEDGIWKQPYDEEHIYMVPASLPDGYYRLLAVGYDDPAKSPVKLDWQENVTNWDSALLTNTGDTPCASEIFTGYPRNAEGGVETYQVNKDAISIRTKIVCRRAVAGVLLYLKNIPSKWEAEDGWKGTGGGTGIITPDLEVGRELKIYEVAIVTVGYNPECNAVTRRWTGDFKYDASRFKLTRIASVKLNPDEADEDGYHNKTFPAIGNFVLPSNTFIAKDSPLVADYAGGMTEPTSKSFDKSLYLCFFTKTGSGAYYPLKLWPIKLVRSYIGDEELEDECAGDLGLGEADPFHYNLVANHLYCLGMYKDDKSVDKPVDLKKEIEEHPEGDFEIRVIGSWQWDINIEM